MYDPALSQAKNEGVTVTSAATTKTGTTVTGQ
jgi:hypothetical protein